MGERESGQEAEGEREREWMHDKRTLRHTSIATLLEGASKSLLARLDLETFAAVSTSVD